jgi:acetyl-CoA acetyltransferase
MALDAIGAWPPIEESHVEMDGAWALYEAWVRLQHGDIDSALVYGFGKSSLGDLPDVLTQQLDPYTVAPLWPDSISLAALQARAMIDAGICDERDMAHVAARSRGNGADIDTMLREPAIASPLRKHDCAPISDGAAAVVLAAGDLARRVCKRPAWIRGIDHRIEPHALGARDLTQSVSTRIAGEKAGVASGAIDVAELHAPFSHQEILLRRALGLNGHTQINPSGGALAANPMMSAGLMRIGEAAQRIIDGDASRAVAHATSGPCLQQNLVCVLEAG